MYQLPVSRRALMRGSMVAVASASVGGLGWLRDPAPGFRALAPEEVRITEALGEALFPEGNPMGVSWREAEIALGVDTILSDYMLPRNAAGVRYMLRTLEIATLLARGTRFSRCPAGMRVAIFEIWSQEDPFPRRLAIDSLRSVVSMAYYDHPSVKAAIGWRAGCDG